MTELKSSLPFEEVKAASTLTIYPVALRDCGYKKARLNFIIDDEQIVANLYEVTNEKVLGYLPSRVWHNDGFNLLYYIGEAMPSQARPFGDKPVYCFHIPLSTKPIEYDANWRVFIDQIAVRDDMYLFVMFNEDQYQDIVNEIL